MESHRENENTNRSPDAEESQPDPFAPPTSRRFRLKGESEGFKGVSGDYVTGSDNQEDSWGSTRDELQREPKIKTPRTEKPNLDHVRGDWMDHPVARFLARALYIWYIWPIITLAGILFWYGRSIWTFAFAVLLIIAAIRLPYAIHQRAARYGDPEWDEEANAYYWWQIWRRRSRF